MTESYSQPEDFLADESFIAWQDRKDPEAATQWEKWMATRENGKLLVDNAISLLQALRVKEKQIDADQLHQAHERIVESAPDRKIPARIFLLNNRFKWVAAASVVLFLFAGVYAVRTYVNRKPQLSSAYGQITESVLPDGTEVVINANSNIRYANLTQENNDREVWLKGEAYFHVSKVNHKRKFIVHTDHFDVIVTGTQFNVVNRNGLSNVMLREGSVTIKTGEGKEIKMLPGDFVEYNHDAPERKSVKNDSLLAWKDKKLVFDNTPLSQVIKIIGEHYGVDINLSNDSLAEKTLSGMLPNDNLDILLQAINATNDFEVVHQENGIMIRNRKQ